MSNKLPILFALSSLIAPIAWASNDFRYFSEPDIDYWKHSNKGTSAPPIAPPTKPTSSGATPSKGFTWEKYMSPMHDEFFREGDYTPPAPFVEIARNPTDENIERWYRYIELKNSTLHRLQERLTEYAQKNPTKVAALPSPYSTGLSVDPEALAKMASRVEKPSAPAPDARRFRLRLYFDSHCPHCEHMLNTTIPQLSSMGYWIELKQVDRDESARARIPFPVSGANPEELKQYRIESVPVLLVGDIQKKSFFKMQGYQDSRSVLAALSH